jgi:hypothetical protein
MPIWAGFMTKHDRRGLARENRLIAENTRAGFMSDTKWKKLFYAIDSSGLDIIQCIVKFVGADEEKTIQRPSRNALHPPNPWIDTPEFGPIPLRSIEWILFPRVATVASIDRTIPGKQYVQDVDAVAGIIAGLGRFPVELTPRGLLITGYLV